MSDIVHCIGPIWSAHATCENGHTQTLCLQGYTREQAELFAGLLDGTSPAYRSKPADCPDGATQIGRCGICGKKFKVEIVEQKTGDAPQALPPGNAGRTD